MRGFHHDRRDAAQRGGARQHTTRNAVFGIVGASLIACIVSMMFAALRRRRPPVPSSTDDVIGTEELDASYAAEYSAVVPAPPRCAAAAQELEEAQTA